MADKAAVIAALARLTRGWRPGEGVTLDELADVHAAIVVALRVGDPSDLADASGPRGAIPPEPADLKAAADAFDRAQAVPQARHRPFIRSSGDAGTRVPFGGNGSSSGVPSGPSSTTRPSSTSST